MDAERKELVYFTAFTFQRRLLCLNFQSTKLENNSNLFLKVNKKLMLCFFCFLPKITSITGPGLQVFNLFYCVLTSESRLIPGRNTAIFPEGFFFTTLILDCQRDNLFLSCRLCFLQGRPAHSQFSSSLQL